MGGARGQLASRAALGTGAEASVLVGEVVGEGGVEDLGVGAVEGGVEVAAEALFGEVGHEEG